MFSVLCLIIMQSGCHAAPATSSPTPTSAMLPTQTPTMDGKPLTSERSTGLVAMNAVAALVATTDKAAEFVEALWSAKIPSGKWRYYDGLLYTLSLLHVSGNFRIYTPE